MTPGFLLSQTLNDRAMARLTNAQIRLFIVLALVESLCAGLLWSREPVTPPLLWRDMPSDALTDQPFPPRKPWVIRERAIAFDPQLLAILKDAAARPHPPITIELFDSVQYQLEVTSTLSTVLLWLAQSKSANASLKSSMSRTDAIGSWSLIPPKFRQNNISSSLFL